MEAERMRQAGAGPAIRLDELDAEERRLIGRLERRARTHPDWSVFGTYWMPAVAEFYDRRGVSRSEMITTPAFAIAQDLSARLGIAQGLITHIPHLRLKVRRVSGGMPSKRSKLR